MLMVVLFPLRRAASALLTRVSDSASRAEVAEIIVNEVHTKKQQVDLDWKRLTFIKDQNVRILD